MCTSDETALSADRTNVTMQVEMPVEIPVEPPLLPENVSVAAVTEEMPRLERKDAVAGIAMDIPLESRSPSPPTLQHKDVVDTLPELDRCEENSLSPDFCHPESEEELNEVDVGDGKLTSGNDVFLGNSLGSSSAGESGRSSTIAVLRQRAGECAIADADSEKTSELCNSRDFADSNDDILRNGFSGSELSIHSGSPAVMSDVDSDENTTMIGELLHTGAAGCSMTANSKPASLADDNDDETVEPCDDFDELDKPAEMDHLPSTELHVNNTNSSDAADNNGTGTETNGNGTFNNGTGTETNGNIFGTFSPHSSESEPGSFLQSPIADDAGSVAVTDVNRVDENTVFVISEETPQTGTDETTVSSPRQVVQSSSTSVLEKLLNEPNHVPSAARRGPSSMAVVDSQLNPVVRHNELNSRSAAAPPSAAVSDVGLMEDDGHLVAPVRQLSEDQYHFVVRSPSDVSQPSAGSQHGVVASPVSVPGSSHLAQFAPTFVNVGSPSLAGNVPRGSCLTPGMENVGSPYATGYRRLSSGSGSHIQPHLVSPEINAADQRMHSPAGYCAEFPSVARQGSYAVRPLLDTSYQSIGGPHSVKSSPGAAVGSPGSSCAIMSPNGHYGRAQSFGSLTHSPATRIDRSPASAGSGGFGGGSSGSAMQQGSFNQPNPSPGTGGASRGMGGGSGMPNRSPVGSTNVFSPAPPATMSPSVAVTSAMGVLSTPVQHPNIAPFSCSPTDGGLPFQFPANIAVPVSATTYASAPSPTPHSLQLLSPSNTTSRYQTVSTSAIPVRRHPHPLASTVGLPPYYGMLPSPTTSMSYAGMIDQPFAEASLDRLTTTFSAGGPPSGRQTALISRTAASDCSLMQLQQLTSRLGNHAGQPPLDVSYRISAPPQSMGLLPPKSDPFGRVVGVPSGAAAVNQACKQSGRRRATASEKASSSPVGSVPPVPLPPHAAGYNMLGMFNSQHQPVPHCTSPLDYQRYFANASFFGQGPPSQLPVQMMSFGAPSSRSSTPFTPQPASQTHGGNQMYSSYNYGRVPSDAFTDLPRQ